MALQALACLPTTVQLGILLKNLLSEVQNFRWLVVAGSGSGGWLQCVIVALMYGVFGGGW